MNRGHPCARERSARGTARPGGAPLTRITKDCFGTVISSLTKMKECVRCEFQRECQAINWAAQEMAAEPVVTRRPHQAAGGDDASKGGPA